MAHFEDKYEQSVQIPPQHQDRQPGRQEQMHPEPEAFMKNYLAAGKLKGKKAVITGGDSGIGRAVAIAFAKEGADVAIIYLEESDDAETTYSMVEKENVTCLRFQGDISVYEFCEQTVNKIIEKFLNIDILVNNAAQQYPIKNFEDLPIDQIRRTFETNIFSYFYMTKATVKYMNEGSSIINSTSVTAYQGHPELIDYSSTKGAIVAFTRSLSLNLINKNIRVNAVAPGPIWTPLILLLLKQKK